MTDFQGKTMTTSSKKKAVKGSKTSSAKKATSAKSSKVSSAKKVVPVQKSSSGSTVDNASQVEELKAAFNRHLRLTLAISHRNGAAKYERFLAIAYAVRDKMAEQWVRTQEVYRERDAKKVYYLSLEFLMGRTLGNSVLALDLEKDLAQALDELGLSLEELREAEEDAGLGNGGLGRLAACFLDSMATLRIPATGMGIRYEYGMFNQKIENCEQVEHPDNWLRRPNPWEVMRMRDTVLVPFYGHVEEYSDPDGRVRRQWVTRDHVMAIPYSTPIPGYRNGTVNTLRLWSARSADEFGLEYFNNGDYLRAMGVTTRNETISKVLYPNDKSVHGKELRLKQQYFLCCAAIYDALRAFRKQHTNLRLLPKKVTFQLNDTHPAIAIAELMRVLVDDEFLDWDVAWNIVSQVFAYTNHTLMPEALERWSVSLFEKLLPRHLEIIYEINERFLRMVSLRWPGDNERLRRMSLIEEGHDKKVRMAFLCIVGSHSVNGVAALHSELLKSTLFKDFYELWPEKFNNKTNGVTQRRWLLKANPALSELISSKIGEGWATDLDQLRGLEPFAKEKAFQKRWQEVKHDAKVKLAQIIAQTRGVVVDPDSLFDVHVKRIHEYKRQLLPLLFAVHLYNRIKAGDRTMVPRTIIIGGKAAPGYWMAKQIIKLINTVAETINVDPDTRGLLRLVFLENYRVSLAERVFPASDLSEQVSTSGTEASGTGNMKFALNGALTIGTLDGANVEIREEVGAENFFLFGMTVQEVDALKESGYSPWEYYESVPELQQAIDLISSGFFSPRQPEAFRPIIESLMTKDPYMVFADFEAYIAAQEEVEKVYRNRSKWTEMSILNTARMGKFSTDRTIAQYNEEIWKAPYIKVE